MLRQGEGNGSMPADFATNKVFFFQQLYDQRNIFLKKFLIMPSQMNQLDVKSTMYIQGVADLVKE